MEVVQVMCHIAANIVLILPLHVLYKHHQPLHLDPAIKFLFRLAWLARIQIPVTVAAAMFIFDVRFEINMDDD
ncbi:hypothetical protein LSAT2_027067 [Lamellibrachia satsuma]|nr:hypothetical protein LSAT2_027067 [Lamellibrachia satsuma]